MNIIIDGRMLFSSGVGVYLKGVLPYFAASNHKIFLLGDTKILQPYISKMKNIEIIKCSTKPFSISELFLFPKKILTVINNMDIYFSPYFNIPGGITIPVCTTIHDVIFLDMPHLVSFFGYFVRKWFYNRAFHLSRIIFTVSAFSKSRIEYFSKQCAPVIITYSSVQEILREVQPNIDIKKNGNIIYVGNIKKHKGLKILIDAFLSARKEGLDADLLVIGSQKDFRTKDVDIEKNIPIEEKNAIKFSGYVNENDLFMLYSNAALLVQPSFYEGFGLPPLEAMFTGTQALISDIPVFKEIYAGFPVTFFRAGDINDLKNKLLELLKNQPLKKIELTHFQKNKYTFQKTAQIILKEIEKLY